MTDQQLTTHLDLPVPSKPKDSGLAGFLTEAGAIRMGIFDGPGGYGSVSDLRANITKAEAFLADCAASSASLRSAMEPMPPADLKREILSLIASWPNASGSDLTGYGAALVLDVADRQPCRYAIKDSFRTLRQTSRFVPSISEVLATLDAAQSRIRNASLHIAAMPEALVLARTALARLEAAEARSAQIRTLQPRSA